MLRWIATFATIMLLTGCVYTQEVVYREPYNSTPYYESDRYVEGDSYYSPAYTGSGDYYYSTGYNRAYYGSSFGVSYFDYPFYYSVFWPISRWYYDPFVYPSYYYGVTWFPRSYMSLSLSYRGGWSGYGWLAYSPYRYSWVDNYYDWRPWYNRYPSYSHYYPTPRYGDARVEASRLADMRRPAMPRNSYPGRSYGQNQNLRNGAAAPAYRSNRAADYGRAGTTSRQGVMQDGVRRVNAGTPRSTPATGAFGNPTRTTNRPAQPRSGSSTPSRPASSSRGELQRLSTSPTSDSPTIRTGTSAISERQRNDLRGYTLPSNNQSPRTRLREDSSPMRQASSDEMRSLSGNRGATSPYATETKPVPATRLQASGRETPTVSRPQSQPSPSGSAGRAYSTTNAMPRNTAAPAPMPSRSSALPGRSATPTQTAPAPTPTRSYSAPSRAPSSSNSSSSSSNSRASSSSSSSSRSKSSSSSSVRRVGSNRSR